MKVFLIVLALISAVVLISPASASAATNAGVKPGSFWYGFDIAFEKINLFFIFNSEGKARKALEYADERLAEAEAVAENNNTDVVKTAITNYESNIAFAAEKSKDVPEKEKAEALLISIADNTSKHQEILADVLTKVPDEAKEAITKAIEVSRKGQEEAMKQIAELKGEVEQLKKEVAELKQGDNESQVAEIEKLKKEVEELKKRPASVAPIQKQTTPPPPVQDDNQSQSQKQNSQSINVAPPNTILCNGIYWTPCQTGQRFYCPATGKAQCLVENNLNQSGLTQSQIDKINEINKTLEQLTNQQKQQQELARQEELKRLECIMALTPEDERIFDPATQDYLRKLRCGVATDADRTNYELSKLRYSVNELKYRLDSKVSFPQSLANQIKPTPIGNVTWEVRWEGSGGVITTSDGGFYQFHCESNTCRSY